MKIKLIYSVLFATIFLVACGGEEEIEELENPKGIIIHGNINGADGVTAVLWVFENQEDRIVDSTTIIGGQFDLFLDTKELREYVLVVGGNIDDPIYLFPDEESGDITINGSMPNLSANYTVSGDQNSSDYRDYLTFLKPYLEQERLLFDQYNSIDQGDKEKRTSLMMQADSINDIEMEYAIDFINNNSSSPVAWIMLSEFYPPSGLGAFDTMNFKYFELVAQEMRVKYPYSEYPEFIDESIDNTKAQIAQLGSTNNNPDAAPELVFNNPEGQPIALSSLRGNVVLIDFWASWCKPCRMENPNVVKTYNKYKDKGFTIYSVSLDSDLAAWKRAIKADNLSWPNHVSDLKGWQSAAAALYKVNSIPATFLLDKDGKVIDQNLRGEQLEQKLQEILG